MICQKGRLLNFLSTLNLDVREQLVYTMSFVSEFCYQFLKISMYLNVSELLNNAVVYVLFI